METGGIFCLKEQGTIGISGWAANHQNLFSEPFSYSSATQRHFLAKIRDLQIDTLPTLPKKAFAVRNFGPALVAVDGRLHVKTEGEREITVTSVAFGAHRTALIDTSGQLWTLDNREIQPGARSIFLKKAVFMGGFRKCTKVVAGRNHFLALVIRDDALQTTASAELEDNISDIFEKNEAHFQNCPECQDNGKMRLSKTMRAADQEHDLMAMLENDFEIVNLAQQTDKNIIMRERRASLGRHRHSSTPNRVKQLKSASSSSGSRVNSFCDDLKDPGSTMSFLSVDRLSLQLHQEESPPDSPEVTKKLRRENFHLSDDFVEVWSWGENQKGQLGHGDLLNRLEPFPISLLTEHHIVDVACGDEFSLALTATGQIYAWGEPFQNNLPSPNSTSPQVFRVGYDQYGLDISASANRATLLIASPLGPTHVLVCQPDQADNKMTIQKLPQFVQGHTCTSIESFQSAIGFSSAARTVAVEESFTLWNLAVRFGRLLRSLTRVSQKIHENCRASCAEDQSATVADLLHKFHLATSGAADALARLSGSIRHAIADREEFSPIKCLLQATSEDILAPLGHYFEAFSDAMALGCFNGIVVSSEADELIGRLCLEFGADSDSLSSRVRKICIKATDFLTTLKCNATEMMVLESVGFLGGKNAVFSTWCKYLMF
ncbi:unnamed protein product, partial [Mesorhabditis spiculigera]